jgi:hypothetical protein
MATSRLSGLRKRMARFGVCRLWKSVSRKSIKYFATLLMNCSGFDLTGLAAF